MEIGKSIEIPFGAKDSELKGWEYTIPEGMEAEIKDGKIIVREKESEDERIRKWIKKELESKYVVDNIVNNVMADKALAWLERQGEQKPSIEICPHSIKSKSYLETGYPVARNPAWSEEDEKMFEFWNLYYEHKVGNWPNKDVVENLEKFRDWLKSLKERCTWKPSDEQLEALYKYVTDGERNLTVGESVLIQHLYNDLKKLKG